jgi:hypothetical protein
MDDFSARSLRGVPAMALSFRITAPAALFLLLAAPARADLPQPACDALAGWSRSFDRAAGWQPNPLALGGRARFNALFAEPATAALFGKPVLAWTAEEARALSTHLAACADTLRRAGNRDGTAALGLLGTQAQRDLPAYLTALEEARAAAPRAIAELAEAPPSLALLRFHRAVAALGTADDAATRANQATSGIAGAPRNSARALLAALRDLPAAEIAPAIAPIAARIDPLATAVANALVAELAAMPATVAGLQQLDRRLQQALPEYGPQLGAAETARVQAAVAARRTAVGEALRDEVLRQVAAVPAAPMGGQMLDRLRQQAMQGSGGAIGPEGMRAIDAAIAARRTAIGAELVGQLLAAIAASRATVPDLTDLRRLETEPPAPAFLALVGTAGMDRIRQAASARRATLGAEIATEVVADAAAIPADAEAFAALDRFTAPAVLDVLPPAEATRVKDAVAARRTAVAAAMLPGFRSALAALPQTDAGLTRLDTEVLPGIAAWPDSAEAERTRFAALAQERRAAILAAVNRAEAGPMRGRVYEGDALKLEFTDRTRVVVTALGGAPAAGTYTEERDGRVFVEVNGRSLVLTRQGRRLVGGPLVVSRVK